MQEFSDFDTCLRESYTKVYLYVLKGQLCRFKKGFFENSNALFYEQSSETALHAKKRFNNLDASVVQPFHYGSRVKKIALFQDFLHLYNNP